ncbi:MAG: GyrI-like domain-containing protein [Flavipsychrobacter sp.]|nr:GyrI-like domain-containing protein [Flavipsychrobacter sp.]
MEKLDLARQYKSYYTAKAKPELVTIPAAQYISITGKGDPSGEEYARRLGALYPVAYALKFMYKALGKDFSVAKLEGLWWYDENKFGNPSMHEAPTTVPRSEWEYRMLIRLPDFVSREHIAPAIETVCFKKKLDLAREVHFFEMHEGTCVQMLHTGPFDQEPETLKHILEFCREHGLKQNGLHHEIYLSDFRKTAPEKLKTILREPVR